MIKNKLYIENRINQLLNILNEFLTKNKESQDIKIISETINKLVELKEKINDLNELNNIQKNIIFLETKYDEFSELSNYFDPIFIEVKNQIHSNEVIKIRKTNKKKREEK